MDRLAAHPWWRAVAVLGIFTLAAGDFWRYLLSWYGWGVIVAILFTLSVIGLVKIRARLLQLPRTLLAVPVLCLISTVWSNYPLETLLGTAGLLVTSVFAAWLALGFGWEGTLGAARAAFRWILGLSIAFELFVAVVIGHRITPFWMPWTGQEDLPDAYYWSRNLLFEGDRIQGIPGNANLLAMTALLGLILFVGRAVEHKPTRPWSIGWAVVAVLTLALTRSGTVLVAALAAGFLIALVLLVRRARGGARLAIGLGGLGLAGVITTLVLVFSQSLLPLIGKSSDLTYRSIIWQTVLELSAERPVAGWGWVSYWPPWVEPYEGLLEFDGVTYYMAHSAYLDILLQLGVIGLLVYGLAIAAASVRTWGRAVDARGADAVRALVALAVLGALLVQGLAESRLLIEIGWALFCVLAIVAHPRHATLARRDESASPVDARPDRDDAPLEDAGGTP